MIKVGQVRLGWYILRMTSGRIGLLMEWKGKVDVFQPSEFMDWGELIWAVRRRCAQAGLRASGIRCEWPGERDRKGSRVTGIWAEVSRLTGPERRWKRLRRVVANRFLIGGGNDKAIPGTTGEEDLHAVREAPGGFPGDGMWDMPRGEEPTAEEIARAFEGEAGDSGF